MQVRIGWSSFIVASAIFVTTNARAQDVPAESPAKQEPGPGEAPAQEEPPKPEPSPPPGSSPPAPSPSPSPSGEDDLSITISGSARPTDMQQLASESLHELRIGQNKSRYALNVFGDVSLGAASRSEGDVVKPDPAFAVGVFDLLFTVDLLSKIRATSELAFQYEPNAPLAELERLHIRYTPTSALFVEMGRFHTDIGYWNVAYHHGRWLQLPIERPRTILLHGGLLPMHMVGAQAGAKVNVGPGRLNFVLATGSARDPIGGTAHDLHGTSFTPIGAVQTKLEAEGLGLTDLRFGLSGLYARIPAEPAFTRPSLPDTGMDEYVGGAHVAYLGLPLTLLTEGYLIDHVIRSHYTSPEAGSRWRTIGVFGVIGYQIDRVTPYVKAEWTHSQRNTVTPDPFYVPEPKVHGPTVALGLLELTLGTRIDVSTWSALKLEYRLTTGDAMRFEDAPHPAIHTGTVNWSFGI
jgi:hypothetical protein